MNVEPRKFAFDPERWLKAYTALMWSFWAAFSLAAPVTVFDANTYNLARLELAWRAGLFGNPLWNNDRQVCLPWTFDAVHLPFIRLGFGAALPSFACFTGLLIIAFRLVANRFGRVAGWWCCSALLSLPTLVYQATSSKNDMAVVFAVASWYYALTLFRECSRRRYLALMALSLAFAAGAKTSGLPLAAILGLFSLWTLRESPRACLAFAGASALGFAAWGSVEIYANNRVVFGRLLGPGA